MISFTISILISIIVPGIAFCAGLEKQGQASFFGSAMPGQTNRDVSSSQVGLTGNIDLNYSPNDKISVRFQPWIKSDPSNKSPDEKFQAEALELTLGWKRRLHKTKVGLSSVNWEGPDFLNPMDVLNAKNYRDPLNISNRSSPQLAYSSQGEKWGLDAVYIPWRSADLMPGNQSPWLPRYLALPTENSDTQFLIPENVQYDVRSYQILGDSLRHNGGLRLKYQGDQWDLAVAAVEEASSPALLHPIASATVIVAPSKVLMLQNPVIIQPVYYKQRSMAAAFSKAWETTILRLSARHSQPTSDDKTLTVSTDSGSQQINIKVPSWSTFAVAEIEKHFSWGDEDLTVIAEYAESKRYASSGVSSFANSLQNVYLLGYRLPFRETWTTTGAFFQDYKTKASYAHFSLAKSLTDHLRLDLRADLFAGGDNSLLGVYDKNDQISSQLTFIF